MKSYIVTRPVFFLIIFFVLQFLFGSGVVGNEAGNAHLRPAAGANYGTFMHGTAVRMKLAAFW